MNTAVKDTVETITTHYIDGAFVESHGREVINIIRPTDRQVIAQVVNTADPLPSLTGRIRGVGAATGVWSIRRGFAYSSATRMCSQPKMSGLV